MKKVTRMLVVMATALWSSTPFTGSAQNVGIGTNSPTYALTVRKDGIGISQENLAGTVEVGFYTTGNTAFVQTHSPHNLFLATGNGSARLTVQHTSGNIGINTVTPTERLHIVGGLRLVNGSEGAGKVLTSDANGVAQWSTAPLGSNKRFRYLIDRSSISTVETIYATGTGITAVNNSIIPAPGNGVRILRLKITFAEAGLYHIDLSTQLITTLGDGKGGLTVGIRDANIPDREFYLARSGFFLGDFSNASRWSSGKDASADIYVQANQSIEFEAFGNFISPFTSDFFQLIVGGYLISQ